MNHIRNRYFDPSHHMHHWQDCALLFQGKRIEALTSGKDENSHLPMGGMGWELLVTCEGLYGEQKMKEISDSFLKPAFWAQTRHLARTTTLNYSDHLVASSLSLEANIQQNIFLMHAVLLIKKTKKNSNNNNTTNNSNVLSSIPSNHLCSGRVSQRIFLSSLQWFYSHF